ncbi:hypothetical protein L0Y65_06310 [Candidatus Micrarchaeota archaeon]|nr:hypothetical protein [Candidatus Micrarchaeota archaeon]
MTTGTCSRCGTSGIMEYGSDGMTYCSSCAFYGMNKQCYRCRMYLPAGELQQYRGQWMCPYCVQDMRDADRKAEEPRMEEKRPHLDIISYPEQCERCGRDLEGRVYILNDKKLCKNCVEDEKDKWGTVGGGPMAAPYRITLGPEKRRKKMSLIESAISGLLHITGIRKKKEIEIVVIGDRMPIGRAKPMAEKPMSGRKADKDARRPQAEGIILEKPEAQKSPSRPSVVPPVSGAPPSKETGTRSELSRVVPGRRAARGKRGKGKTESRPVSGDGEKKKQ